jgi:uncharacterized damage-inducible protein DinB
MTYYGGKDLAAAFRTVRNNTVQIAEEIPESKYEFRAAPDTRSVAHLLTHIALSSRFQLYTHERRIDDLKKLNFPELVQEMRTEEAKPRNKPEIIALLKSEGEKFASFVEGLPEAFLTEQVAMPPGAPQPVKSRFEMLLSTKEHEMHHRGQLMLIQRMLGQVPHLTRQFQERMAAQAQAAR